MQAFVLLCSAHHSERQNPARGLLESAGNAPGMAAYPRREGHRCCREEGQEDRAVQSVEGDCLEPLAERRDLTKVQTGCRLRLSEYGL